MQALFCDGKGLGLDVKGQDRAVGAAEVGEKEGVVAVSHGGVDGKVAGADLVLDEMGGPGGDLVGFHDCVYLSVIM